MIPLLNNLVRAFGRKVDLDELAIILVHPSHHAVWRRTIRSPGSVKLDDGGWAVAFCPREFFATDPRDGRASILAYLEGEEPTIYLVADDGEAPVFKRLPVGQA